MLINIVGDFQIQEKKIRCRKDEYFETCCDKLEQILSSADKVIFLGDLFENETIPIFYLNRLIEIFARHPGKSYSIIGNHDIYNYNPTTLSKTSLGLLNNVGLVKVMTKSFELGGYHFGVIPLNVDLSNVPVDVNNNSILLGHCFFENSLDVKYSLTTEQIVKLNYRYIFLGHEHEPHATKEIGNSYLVRMGAVIRDEARSYNLTRIPYYTQIDTSTGSMEFKNLNVQPACELFSEDFLIGKKETKVMSVLDMDDLINSGFTKKIKKENGLLGYLKQREAEEECVEYLKCIHEDEGVAFF